MMQENITEFKRRASDKRLLDIETMIAEENDPQQRAILIVLNNINVSLLANTESIREIGSRLESHLDEYQSHVDKENAIKNKGIGAWKVLAWVLGIAQTVVIGVGVSINSKLNEHTTTIQSAQIVDAKILERQTALEDLVHTHLKAKQ